MKQSVIYYYTAWRGSSCPIPFKLQTCLTVNDCLGLAGNFSDLFETRELPIILKRREIPNWEQQ